MSIYLGKNKVGIAAIESGGDRNNAKDDIIMRTISGSYENTRVTLIGPYAFYYCTSLTTVSFPACTTIGSHAFDNCKGLTTVSFPVCTTIEQNAFTQCSGLTTVNFPICTSIRSYAFYYCKGLTTVSFPVCTTIEQNAFASCSRLTTVSFPACTSIRSYAFYSCTSLTTVSFPACTTIGSYAFYSCTSLTTVILNASQTTQNLYLSAFAYCYNLTSLYLLASTMYKLANTNVFVSTPISNYTTYTGGVNGSIFVQSSLYASYIAATNWTTYSARFVSLTDAQIIAL